MNIDMFPRATSMVTPLQMETKIRLSVKEMYIYAGQQNEIEKSVDISE